MGMTVAIHQPNFLPWLGWFDKLDRCDVFILLDSVQLIRRSVTTRASALRNGEPVRVVVPVRHTATQDLVIRDAQIDVASPLLRKTRQSLYHCYAKCPFWRDYGEPVLEILGGDYFKLLDLNLALLRYLAGALEIDWSKVQMQSALSFQGKKSELMATLARNAGGDTYLSGGSDPAGNLTEGKTGTAADYNDPAVYSAHGITLQYQNFVHPTYQQKCNPFVPGLTVLDALVRLGPDTMNCVREANGRPRSIAAPAR